MSKDEIKHFKSYLSDYKYFVNRLDKINEQILILDVKRGVKSPSLDSQHSSSDPVTKEINKLEDIDKYQELLSKKDKYQKKLDIINQFIEFSRCGESVKKIYCLKTSTYEKEARQLSVSAISLKRMVNHDIQKFKEKRV